MTARSGASGFTLVELLLVVVVLSAIALIGVLGVRPTTRPKLELAASELADALRFARSEAMRTSNYHGVHVDPVQNRVRVYRGDGGSPPVPIFDVRHPVTKRLHQLDFDDDRRVAGVVLSGESATWTGPCVVTNTVTFDPQGTPVCSQSLGVLLQQATVTLSYTGASLTLALDGETGRIYAQ